jgi:hypothetical protein
MRVHQNLKCWSGALVILLASVGAAQTAAPKANASMPRVATDPVTPQAQDFHDRRYGISFRVPAGWNVTTRDGDVSTFRLDARSVTKATQLRAVASIGFNPLPRSTFSGALFYASLTPGISAAECRSQVAGTGSAPKASGLQPRVIESAQIGGVGFDHGHDEHGGICTESRDEVYTAMRKDGCYRFDLVVNNFCGGDVSGVADMSAKEIESMRKRLEVILESVRLDGK